MDRLRLIHAIRNYATPFAEEKAFVPRFLSLLEHPECFLRTHLPGHLTGSAWIVTPDRKKVLLVHHAKLGKWLQPGGHADGDEDVLRVAMREAEEETGLKVAASTPTIFDLDIHAIPARKDFPEHDHYDLRFVVEADEAAPLAISSESTDLKWVRMAELHQYNNSPSLLRMKEKCMTLA